MKSFSFRQTLIKGAALALPLAIVAYVLIRIVGILEKVIAPIARKAGLSNFLGEMTLTVISVFVLLVLVFLLGLLMQLGIVSNFRRHLQDWIIKIIPSLNHLKLIAEEKLDIKDAAGTWKPVLLENGDQFFPAFIVEETEDWLTLVSVKPPFAEPHTIFIAKAGSIRYKEISIKEMMQFNKQFGKGYLSLLKS